MTTKCLLVCENDFMVAGIKLALAEQADLEVFTINAIVEAELAQTIKMINPDVVILDEGLRRTPSAQLRKLLMGLPNLRLIILNHEDNVLRIYQEQWFEEAQVQDLEKVIRK